MFTYSLLSQNLRVPFFVDARKAHFSVFQIEFLITSQFVTTKWILVDANTYQLQNCHHLVPLQIQNFKTFLNKISCNKYKSHNRKNYILVLNNISLHQWEIPGRCHQISFSYSSTNTLLNVNKVDYDVCMFQVEFF